MKLNDCQVLCSALHDLTWHFCTGHEHWRHNCQTSNGFPRRAAFPCDHAPPTAKTIAVPKGLCSLPLALITNQTKTTTDFHLTTSPKYFSPSSSPVSALLRLEGHLAVEDIGVCASQWWQCVCVWVGVFEEASKTLSNAAALLYLCRINARVNLTYSGNLIRETALGSNE